jgi:PAS domain S-box-containing protein
VGIAASLAGGLSLVMLAIAVGSAQGMPAPADGPLYQSGLAAGLMVALSVAVLLGRRNGGGKASRLGLALAGAAVAIPLAVLVAYAFGWGLATMARSGGGKLPWLRLSVLTSISALFLALAYLAGPAFPGAPWRRRQFGALLASVPMGIGVIVLMCYPEGAALLNGARSTPISLPSAVACVLLGLALLVSAGADTWPLALFGSERARSESTGSLWVRWGPLKVFLALALSIFVLGSLYLRSQVNAARQGAEKELLADSEGKAREIGSWFAERRGDADQILGSSLLQDGLRRFLKGDEGDREGLLTWMASLSHGYGYQRVQLYDGKGVLRLGIGGLTPQDRYGPDLPNLHAALLARGVLLADLHRSASRPQVHLSFWIPIGLSATAGHLAEGAVLLSVDARQYLYPLLVAPSSLGPTGETMLVGRDGNEAVCLSDLRFRANAALHMRIPLKTDSPMALAARGEHRLTTAQGYLGSLVVAAMRPVPGTPWVLVTQVDEGAIFGPLRRWAWLTAAALLGTVGMLAMGMGLMVRQEDARRILAQLAFERERKALSERFAKAFSTSPDAMSVNRLKDGVYLDVNEGFCQMTGYTLNELVGHSSRKEDLQLWVHNADRERLVAALQAQGEVVDLEATFRKKDGSTIQGLMSAKLLEFDHEACLISATRDITQLKRGEEDRRQLQAQLHQSQKQESLGALAGGVAHDMNNVLGAILSLASAHRAQVEPLDPLAASFETIINACLRGRSVVKSLLYFARKDLEEVQAVSLNVLVREVVQLLAHTTLQRIRLETSLEEDLRPVLGDAGALTHALMNLCLNAMDAMPAGGTLTLKTENLGEDKVRVTVTDTGEGMSAEVRDRACEPFFTTKPVGKGTGLGLAMVFGTVKAHGGKLALTSAPGQGTAAILTFQASEAPPPPPPVSPQVLDQGSLAILLVDDDELIRASVTPMLGLLGHRAQAAAGGREALGLLAGGLAVDLVILDLNMPEMTGAETLARMLEAHPAQRVLLASGYSDGDVGALLAGRPGVSFIQKPFSLQELQGKLGGVVMEPAGARSTGP